MDNATKTIDIKIFRFDSKRDYLPYYKSYSIKVLPHLSVQEIVMSIQKDFEPGLGFDLEKVSHIVCNGWVCGIQMTCEKLIQKFGTELCFEPISKVHSVCDFITDDTDFFAAIKPFERFFDTVELELYQEYKAYHYTSRVQRYRHDYIGSGVLLFIADMYEGLDLQRKYEICTMIAQDDGIWLYTNLKNRFVLYSREDEKIEKLKNAVMEFAPDLSHIVKVQKEYLDICLHQSKDAQPLYQEVSK